MLLRQWAQRATSVIAGIIGSPGPAFRGSYSAVTVVFEVNHHLFVDGVCVSIMWKDILRSDMKKVLDVECETGDNGIDLLDFVFLFFSGCFYPITPRAKSVQQNANYHGQECAYEYRGDRPPLRLLCANGR